jgi:hypothetical protein
MAGRSRSRSPGGSRSNGDSDQPEDGLQFTEADILDAVARTYQELGASQNRVGNPPVNLEDVYAGVISDDNRQNRCVAYCRSLLDARDDDAPSEAVLRLALEDGFNKMHNRAGM